ncbi:helix-turn-helix domain-containing protein [Paenibacillus alvei]|uniref:helix-turn-helix domain-containing protein n=1 Tax=Paenibacillus alvei TaxID=44250 RepID=UPI0018CE3744|nr:helix-turn-helix transcriptional regulator [Paenibacillus alvei]MCY9579591.1 helix-turn-helix domain-containing protein [Paenibacillus alvei]MCY9586551.1 helix-turn-helix domain-containing protein [Paenibacillus alvei]
MAISENIKKLRERYGLTQQELAEIAGVTNKAVSAWESGLSEPRMGAIEKMATRFNIKKSNIIEDGGMDLLISDTPLTIAAHFEGEDFTEDEIQEIMEYAKYIKSKRK